MAFGMYGISAQQQTFPFYQTKSSGMFQQAQKPEPETKISTKNEQLREMIRNMNRTQTDNPYAAGSSTSYLSSLTDPAKSEEEEELQKLSKYNYKDVSNKIQRAKTALSAGQALIAAKRKVIEIKRKISSGDGDAEELQLALTHARRMEMVARKKKHHLELEEMIVVTQKRDEKLDQMEESAANIQNQVLDMAQEELAGQQDAILEERSKLLDELKELQEENLTELNEMISEFGEEELQEIQEAMDLLENMEIINPHMSKEDLEELKRKHRNEEYKAILKAEMDYLKDFMKYVQEKGTGMSLNPISPGSSAAIPSAGIASAGTASSAAPTMGINIQV